MSRTAKEIGFVEAKDHNLVKRKETADDKWLAELYGKERMDFLNIKEGEVMAKFEEDFNYLIELSGKVLLGLTDAENFEENRKAFFEKYEPKALPVIPQFVADEIEREKRDENSFYNLDTYTYTSDKFDNWLCESTIETLMRAWLDGYTIEEEKKYYLREMNTGFYLAKFGNEKEEVELVRMPRFDEDNEFTEEWFDCLEIGSYEKIEVDK